MSPQNSPLKTLFKEHKAVFLIGIGIIVIAILVISIILANSSTDDGVEGDDSKNYDASLAEDQKALSQNEAFKISSYLPIVSKSPSYEISYLLETDEEGNYSFRLTLYSLSASSRTIMINRLLSENFGKYDPLDYPIKILNYYNPFNGYTLNDLKNNNLPTNITNSNLYTFDNSPYSVRTLTHPLYDGTTNTYRYVLENNEPKSMPQLIFTYGELPYLDHDMVKSLNSLE